jgi:hypothetical protein
VTSPTALELLQIRLEGADGIHVACAEEGQALCLGADVPEPFARELRTIFANACASVDPTHPPVALARDDDGIVIRGGPSYLIEEGARFVTDVHIVRSDRSRGERLRGANPGNWHTVEWTELLDGALGPWTIATIDDRVASICHTPHAMTARAAECGVWTHPDFRGCGYAAAVTSAWAELVRPSGRWLFYSTDAANLSSRRVAERLGLRTLGWTWHLDRARPDDNIHPLSRLRSPKLD